MNEDQYWKDFMTGRSLKKYGVKTIKEIKLDRWQSQDISFFAAEAQKKKDQNEPTGI